MNAYEWGVKHGSCEEALEKRKEFASQEEWWEACDRGDWLLWQLRNGLTDRQLNAVRPAILRAVERIVVRAVTNHCLHCGVDEVEVWAREWLKGGDRTTRAARAAARVEGAVWTAVRAAEAARAAWTVEEEWAARAAWAAAWAAEVVELRDQADDIRQEIPHWIWG